MTLQSQVEYILERYEEARNSDAKLSVLLWRNYYRGYLRKSKSDGEYYIKLNDFIELPNQETIGRWRRKMQEAGKYLPTSIEVAHRRKQKVGEWKKDLGYRQPEHAIFEKKAEDHVIKIKQEKLI